MAIYLDEIVAWHRNRASTDGRSRAELEQSVQDLAATRGFAGALRSGSMRSSTVSVIAEIKRRSPSRGSLAEDLDPSVLAKRYEHAGAACLSVLTDRPHFAGSPDDLAAASRGVSIPVLRKDFTVALCDLFDARAMGADAVLLIVAALSDGELQAFLALSSELALDALVEVHDEAELRRALDLGASLIGVNQRDLRTFEVDPLRAVALAEAIPTELTRVAESGVKTRDDVERLIEAGFDAILVGEALVTASDPEDAIRTLSGRAL